MTNQLPEKLLAKGRKDGRDDITLQSHLEDTEKAAREIFCLEKRWGKNWCRFFKIYEKSEQEKFLLNLRIAALFHDIGKANEDFQRAVSQNGYYQQTIRHEHLSALILHLSEVREWLSQNENLDLEVITGAVLSHHIKASADNEKWKWMQPKGKLFLQLFDSHEELNTIFDRIKEIAGLSTNLRIDKKLWSEKSPWIESQDGGFDTAVKFRRIIKKDAKRLNLLLAVKAGLIASDAVASGLVREGEEIENWINEKAHSKTIEKDEVATAIINKRAEKIFKDKPVKWNDFQLKSATLGKRALLLAACGSGKTIAAWKWAEAQSQTHEIGKVIFLYPTRGTATEGFKDYVGYAPETEASLLHGTAKYELEEIRRNPTDDKEDKNYETNARLFALGFWGKRYFSATVDQFLSFLEHSYSSLCLLPVLADSAVIIDEVHSFDKQMFENLVCFLKNFDVPVLCMTATLSESRIKNLEKDGGLRVYPNKEEQYELKDLEEKEVHPRYNLEFVTNEDHALKIAATEYKAGKRVLWVVNTVKRCQNIAKRLKKEHAIKSLVYHSRFRLVDRKNKHEATVDAFKQTESPQIAITTQVCEMSLDLDADVLITEIAPIPSLVQRFGRSNRHLEGKPKEFRSRLVVYMPESDKPYNQKEDLEPALTFLKDLPQKDISQRCLAEKLEEHAKKERPHEGDFAPFLSSGYYAVPGNFREIDNFTNPCILWDDLAEVKGRLENKDSIDAYIISVPKKYIQNDITKPSWVPKYLSIADSKFYFNDFGFMTELEDDNSKTLTLEYNLAELPSSQHRAGLAGLILMVKWLANEPDKKGICEITQIDATSTTLQIDQEGLQYLFEKVYAASKEEVGRETKLKNKAKEEIPPLREEQRTITDKEGKSKEKTFYIYPQVIPHGAFLVDYDKSENGVWIKLWRNMIWSILRGVPATRRPYDERSEGEFTEDADKAWQELNQKAGYTVDLPSTYFIGAQASNAENVSFKDLARCQFLLHFWAFVAQIYIPLTWTFDRKTNRESPKDNGYALVIPDIADLETFCDELPDVLRSRGNELFGYRPKESVVDIAAEGALDLMHKINQRLATKINRQVSDLLLGVDVVHLEKQGNNIRLWGNSRIDPVRPMIDEYVRVKEHFKNQLFRKQMMLNVLNEKEWFYGFGSLLSKTDSEQTIGQSFFRNDVRKAFEDIGVTNKSIGANNMEANSQEAIPKTIKEIIYRLVSNYIREKLRNKYDLEWGKVKNTPDERKYNEMKGKIAREAFLAIRSRTDEDFVDYFVSTLCSYYQFSLKGDGFDLVAKALYDEESRVQVRTLTMLALSANGYSPKSDKQGEI